MIPQSVLNELVPYEFPDSDISKELLASFDGAPELQQRLTLWAEATKNELRLALRDDPKLDQRLRSCSGVAVGIFELDGPPRGDFNGFPFVGGYQFGIGILQGRSEDEMDIEGRNELSFGSTRYSLPIFDLQVEYQPHKNGLQGFPAVHYQEAGNACALTAGHVVGNTRKGKTVPLICSDCGASAVLQRRTFPALDAVEITFPCGGPYYFHGGGAHQDALSLRRARKGETVELHFGDTGLRRGTVMNDVSSYSEIISGAAAVLLYIDSHGARGDSGSLVSSIFKDSENRDALSMYLGEVGVKTADGFFKQCGYAIDLRQVTDVMGLNGPFYGEFQ